MSADELRDRTLEAQGLIGPPTDGCTLDGFHAPVREWFRETFGAPTRAQELGWPLIQRGESTSILT
jgi:hypothetical protein